MAYSPLGRGFLSGRFQSPDDLEASDFRRTGRGSRGVTPAQLALAWVLARGEDIVPIQGQAAQVLGRRTPPPFDVELSADDLARIEAELPTVSGERYDESGMASVNLW